MISKTQLQEHLSKPYERDIFVKEIMRNVFSTELQIFSPAQPPYHSPAESELKVIDKVEIYGKINLKDGTEIQCYEILLKPQVRIEHNKVTIQKYARKLLVSGQAALINFISPKSKDIWRFTLISKQSDFKQGDLVDKTTHTKRFTYLVEADSTNKTLAERLEHLSIQTEINLETLNEAFSVEKLSNDFFKEYKYQYERIADYISESNFQRSVFNGDNKIVRDFTKKLLGRIVFLYFVQKKGWLGATDTNYTDGDKNFIFDLFISSGANDNFYQLWLCPLFFETLNKERTDDNFEMPEGHKVKIPFLNGGLFDEDNSKERSITFDPNLFHSKDNAEIPSQRGFLDFLNSFNFTIYEDSPDDITIAVDPEMLGNIFENLLEDNKDKGAYYTPKEIVHYMCQESLIEYLTTNLSKDYKVYAKLGNDQVQMFGNETEKDQMSIIEEIGDDGLDKSEIEEIVREKDIKGLTDEHLRKINTLLTNVKICDPAIGSGAFPMGLLQEIFAIKEAIAINLGLKWNAFKEKESIIQNSIYGVDIEKGAVDIARLRFWLSLVVDEEFPHPLPNLDYKIVVGNSIVPIFNEDIFEINWNLHKSISSTERFFDSIKLSLNSLINKQKLYFSTDKNKNKLKIEIRNHLIDIVIAQLEINKIILTSSNLSQESFLEPIQSPTNDIKSSAKEVNNLISTLYKTKDSPTEVLKYFDWELNFPEIMNSLLTNKIGFDIVIGNPPYVSQKGKVNDPKIKFEYRDFFRKNYETFKSVNSKGGVKINLFGVIAEKGLKLLNSNGIFIMIIHKNLLKVASYKYLRKYILDNYYLSKIIDLKSKAFPHITAETIIIQINSSKSNNLDVKYISELKELLNGNSKRMQQSLFEKNDDFIFNIYEVPFLKDIERKDYIVRLGEIIKIVAFGLDTINNKKYFVDTPQSTFYKPAVMGRNISRWLPSSNGFVYYNKDVLSRDGNPKVFKVKEKIIMQRVSSNLTAAYDDNQLYCFNSTNILYEPHINYDLKYILAILNSKFLNFYYNKTFSLEAEKTVNVTVTYLSQLIIPIIDLQKQQIISFIVDIILFLKRRKVDFELFEIFLNYLIYQVYFDLKEFDCFSLVNNEFTSQASLNIDNINKLRIRLEISMVNVSQYFMDLPEIQLIEGYFARK